MWPVGISTILQRPLTIPLYSPTRRQMPAIKAVQGDCESIYFCWCHWIGVVEWVENKLARAFSVLITWKLVTSSRQDEYCWCPSLFRGEALAHTDAVYPIKYVHSFIGLYFVYIIIGVISFIYLYSSGWLNSLAPGKFEWIFCHFQTDFSDWWMRHLLWNSPNMNITGPLLMVSQHWFR